MSFLLASKNPGKLREIRSILAGLSIAAPPESWIAPDETGVSYAENALLKARALAAVTGLPCLGDDSGIEVDALDGAPGPRSARFAGDDASDEENLRKMIDVIRSTDRRDARYRCVAVLVTAEGEEQVAEGTLEGALITEPRGEGGFGYDPIFVPAGESRTVAEMTTEDKDAISHRGKAFRALLPALREARPRSRPL